MCSHQDKGYFHIYTGNGKGKTTAAFGLALRAVMAGKTVYIGQFVKGIAYNETKWAAYVPGVEIHQFGRGCFIEREPCEEDVRLAEAGLKASSEALQCGRYDLVILDELTIALHYKLLSLEDVVDAICARAPHTEAVATGRYAPQALIDMADIATEMKEIRHYYTKGVLARDGIDR
jgi:cob(I)alamin adenosyltransferase